MPRDVRLSRYENTVLPHLDAAYNLALWLTGEAHDAQDVAQEAAVRAYRHIDSFRGGDPRAWFLRIVRNTAYTWLRKHRGHEVDMLPLDDALASASSNPEKIAMRNIEADAIRRGLELLAPEFREILVLREMEGLAYKEIAEITDVPIGTVMSRLARARKLLRSHLSEMIDSERLPPARSKGKEGGGPLGL